MNCKIRYLSAQIQHKFENIYPSFFCSAAYFSVFIKPPSHLLIFLRKALRAVLRKCLRTDCVLHKVLLTFAYFCT